MAYRQHNGGVVDNFVDNFAGLRFTPRMEAALVHYATSRSKTEAYRSAYDCSRMTLRTSRRRALEVFNHPLMHAAVTTIEATALATVKDVVKIDAAWVLKRAALLADFNIAAFIIVNGEGQAYYDFSDATEEDWYCISEYTVDTIVKGYGEDKYEVERVKLKTNCKLRALELVGKHTDVQAFREQIELQGVIAHVDLAEFKQARREVIEHDDV